MKDEKPKKFQTSIREPRWQQIVSIAIVILFVVVELFVFIRRVLHH